MNDEPAPVISAALAFSDTDADSNKTENVLFNVNFMNFSALIELIQR